MTPLLFTAADADRAYASWGANCGPGAIAAVAGLSLDALRPMLGDFEAKRYTNPTLMWAVLDRLVEAGQIAGWHLQRPTLSWPEYGLARVQWHGPWTKPGVPARVAYGKTHWVGSRWSAASATRPRYEIFDINAMTEGGWISETLWATSLVPWILESYPKADGRWTLTHCVAVTPAAACPPSRTGAEGAAA